MSVKILHSADWQIGKAFAGIGDVNEGDKAAELRTQRLKTVHRVAEVAVEHDVDAVLVAGDVFETNAVSDESLRRTIQALSAYQGQWLLLPGNHDAALAESAWTRLHRLNLPDNVKLLTRPEPVLIADHQLAILPAPLTRRHEAVDITEAMDAMQTPKDTVRIGIAHGSISNRLPERSEALNEIAEDRADRARLDYLALGDWHGTLKISPRTWYAGTPEPDRFKENSPGNVLLVTIEGPGAAPQVEPIAVGHFRWHQIKIEVHRDRDLQALGVLFEQLGRPYDRHLVSLTVSGTVDLALREALCRFLDEWRARFHLLRLSMSQLVAIPSDDDLDRIDTLGFIRTAVNQLRGLAGDSSNPQRDSARLALQILYTEHVRAGRVEP